MKRLLLWVVCCAALLLALLFIANTLNPARLQENFSSIEITPASYTNCEVALSLIVKQDNTLSGALSPNTYGNINDGGPCQLFSEIHNNKANGEPIEIVGDNTLRLRYIWGFRAVQGIAVSVFTVNTVQKFVVLLTFASIAMIGLLTYRRDTKSAACLAPFLIGGALFSGVLDASALPIALSYLWAWLAGMILIWAQDRDRDKEFSTIAGMISAYLWFMEGHFILLTTLIGLITYLHNFQISAQTHSQIRASNHLAFKLAIKNIIFAHLGFILLTATFIAIKFSVFGLDVTLASFSSAIDDRSSLYNNDSLPITLQSLAHKLLFVSFQLTSTYSSVWLWKTILVTSFIALLGIVGYASIKAHRIKYSAHYLLLITLIALYLGLRFLIVPNHTYIHAALMSRYLIIPIASIWSCAAYLYFIQKQMLKKQGH